MEYALRKRYSCQKFVKTDGFQLKHLFPAQSSLSSGTIENAILTFLQNKSNYLKASFCHIIAYCLERTKSRNHSMVKSIGLFDL